MNKYDIAVVTGTRAEYGLLRPLLFKLLNHSRISLKLIVTGSHLSSYFGNTKDEIIKDGFNDFISIPIPIEDDSKKGMAEVTGVAIEKFASLFSDYKPDLLIVLGDRFEILSVAIAAFFQGIKVAHIAGGDVTEGAVDDAIRHCITKMSVLHFPESEDSRKRIIQLGENPYNVYNVGALSIENCVNMNLLSREDLAYNLNFDDINKDYSVVTYHPVTMERDTASKQVYELISAMDEITDMSYIITMANADAGGREINDIWMKESASHPNWLVVSSLGVQRYLSALKFSKLCIGNSSSGLIEAPAFGIPSIDVGDRQKGRIRSNVVISCDCNQIDIIKAIKKGLNQHYREIVQSSPHPFGDGSTSQKIIDIILDYLDNNQTCIRKKFYDLK